MKPLIIILGLRGSGRLTVAKELAENGWSDGKRIRTFREAREAESGAADTWAFAAGAATLPAPGDADAGILVTHGGLSAVDQMEALHRALPASGWQVQRIVTVVDCPLTQRHPDVAKWHTPMDHATCLMGPTPIADSARRPRHEKAPPATARDTTFTEVDVQASCLKGHAGNLVKPRYFLDHSIQLFLVAKTIHD
jgi:hypothetical protein